MSYEFCSMSWNILFFLFEGIPYVYSIIIVYCLSKGRNLLHSLSMEGFFDEGQAGDTFLCICIWNSFQKSIKLMFLAVSSSIKIMPPNLYSRVGFLTLNILLFNLGYLLLRFITLRSFMNHYPLLLNNSDLTNFRITKRVSHV